MSDDKVAGGHHMNSFVTEETWKKFKAMAVLKGVTSEKFVSEVLEEAAKNLKWPTN